MTQIKNVSGALMRAEIDEAPDKFSDIVSRDLSATSDAASLQNARAVYTIARGSSDAAANIIAYEMMTHLGIPVTTLPPSVFSLKPGVNMQGSVGLVISQSGGSSDLIKACAGINDKGGRTVLLTNTAASPASKVAHAVVDIGAGPELAIPATKSVICTIGAGMALLAAAAPGYHKACTDAAAAMVAAKNKSFPQLSQIEAALKTSDSVFVMGRGCGFGAAQEIALKFKECCALHAEAYSSSEVLHGPLQLATKPLTVIILDTDEPDIQESLNIAQSRFEAINTPVFRLSPAGIGLTGISPAAAAAILLYALYPVVHDVAIARGMDPDAPETLAKITDTV